MVAQDEDSEAGLAAFRQAEAIEQSGKQSKARDAFKALAKSYPNSKVGAESQFRVAQIRDKEGEGKRAFDEYQELITKYRTTPHFQTAIERQFAIAESLKNTEKKGFLGIGASAQPSELKEMYEQIADSAPYSQFAPRSLMAIAEVNIREGATGDAIRNYQSVVDHYRGTEYAKESQYQVYKLRGDVANNSNSPSEDRSQVAAGLEFVASNPDDNRAEEVRKSLEEIEERELDKNFKTGQFYEEKGEYKAALVYYREIAKKPSSKHYDSTLTRINEMERRLAGEEVEEKANRFGSLPSLPKIKAPKFRIGKKEEVIPLPLEPATEAEATPPSQ